MKKILVTICGRAGSKGLKNKNLKIFLGYPLVYYTLSSAFDFKGKSENTEIDVCLNTDSEDLQKLVKQKYQDVFIIHRPIELTNDLVPKMAVWRHSLFYMEKYKNILYDYVIDLDITSPLRQKNDVIAAYKLKCNRNDVDLVFSVCKSRRNPYFNMVQKNGKYAEKVFISDFTCRQQTPDIYDMNASIYVCNADFLRNNSNNNIWDAKCDIYVMKDTAVLDIDSEEDFKHMEIIGDYLFNKFDSYKIVRDQIR